MQFATPALQQSGLLASGSSARFSSTSEASECFWKIRPLRRRMRISTRPPGCKNFRGCCVVRFQQPALLVIGHGKDSHGAPVHRVVGVFKV